VTNEIHHQESSPSKKVYTITKEGLEELKEWVISSPEPPEFKKMFLVQLAWSNQLNAEEINTLLSNYENEIRMQILMHQEKKRRETFSPNRTSREAHVWDLIYENVLSSFENELSWIQKARKEICSDIKEINNMNYKVIQKDNIKYIECDSIETQIASEQDALDLCVACIENNTNILLIHAETLAEDFFKLRTGLAGQVMQKFTNYHVKAAVLLTSEVKISSKFKELLAESNKRNDFRTFGSIAEAENWILSL
jgi:PadR family transcriptional regulator, regulatory protein AphA